MNRLVDGIKVPMNEIEIAEKLAEDAMNGIEGMSRINGFDAKMALLKSDIVIWRCYENGITVPDDWKDYRSTLRDIASNRSHVSLPSPPPYPE